MAEFEPNPFPHAVSDTRADDSCLRDVVALSTLPTMWLGADPLRIAESLAASLFTTIDPEFVYVSFTDNSSEAPIAVAQMDRYHTNSAVANTVGASIVEWARTHDPDDFLILPNPLRSGCLRVTVYPLGADAEFGVIAAAFTEDHLPTSFQRLILSVGASHAFTAVQNARLVCSLRDSEERNRRANTDLLRNLNDLEKANVEIRDARRAALNLMEDAVQSRNRIEKLNQELRREIAERAQVEADLRERESELKAEAEALARLNELSSRLWRSAGLREGLEEMLAATIELLGADMGNVQVLDAERRVLIIDAQHGFGPDFLVFFREVSAEDNSACGRALRLGERIVIEDIETDTPYAPLRAMARAAGYRAVQSTPLMARSGTPLGMISTHFRSVHRSTEQDLRRLDLYVRQAADFIERCRTEEALRKSEQETKRARDYAEATLRTSPVPLLVLEKDLRVNTANEAFYHTFQVGTAETQGRLVYELGNGQWNIPKLRGLLESILSQDTVFKKFEVTHDFESIGRRTMLLNARRMENVPDTLERIVLVIDDITERKQAEEALRRLNDELEQRVADRTRDLMQSQNRLRAMATELNLAEQRERKRLATELHDHLQQTLVLGRLLVGQGKRAAAPVPACLDVMKKVDDILSEALTYTRTLVADLSPPVLRDHGLMAGLKWLGEYMKKHQITVTVTVPETDDLKLPEDQAVLLFQSVRELLINSSKHAGTREVDVRLERYDGQLRIEVSDQGVGFDLAAAAAAAAGTPSGGISSKFGLFSIQERMRALGGTFDVQSAPGQGTAATLTMPLLQQHEAKVKVEANGAEAILHSSSAVTSAAQQLVSTIRVLLVDDHPMMRQGLRSIVTAYDHLEVVGEAGDGMEAIELAQRLDPDVVVMDINMPKMDGIEATQQIKANHPATVVIGLSVNQSADTEQKMKAAGAFAYLTKESAVDALCHAIEQAVLSKRHTAACPVY